MLVLLVALVVRGAAAPPPDPGRAVRHANYRAAPWARRYHVALPLARRIVYHADRSHIPLPIAFRLLRVESNFNRDAVSDSGAIGLGQMMVSTARMLRPGTTAPELRLPNINLALSYRYLDLMHRRYRNWPRALTAYNQGPGVADTLASVDSFAYQLEVLAQSRPSLSMAFVRSWSQP